MAGVGGREVSGVRVLALSASPRAGGNSETLLDEVCRGLQEGRRGQGEGPAVEKIRLGELTIRPCTQCDWCRERPTCVLDDDMKQLYPRLREADWLILASPIYFMAHCAQAKLAIDRCQVFWASRYVRHERLQQAGRPRRRGVFVGAGATHGSKVFAGAKVTMKWLFDALDMEYFADCCHEGLDSKGAVLGHPTALGEAYALGQRMATAGRPAGQESGAGAAGAAEAL